MLCVRPIHGHDQWLFHFAADRTGCEAKVGVPRRRRRPGTSEPPGKAAENGKTLGTLQFIDLDLVKGTLKGHVVKTTGSERSVFVSMGESWELLVKPATKITIDGKDAGACRSATDHNLPRFRKTSYVDVEAELEVGDGPKQNKPDELAKYKGLAIRVDVTGPHEREVVQAGHANKNTMRIKKTPRSY